MIYMSDLEKLEFIHSALMEARNSPEVNKSDLETALMYVRDLQQPHLRSHDYLIRKKSDKVDPKIRNRTAELFNFKKHDV